MESVYLDTNAFVVGFESDAPSSFHVRYLFEVSNKRSCMITTSELTLAELFAPIKRPDAAPPDARQHLYTDLLIESAKVNLVAVSRSILIGTVTLRQNFPLKLIDAIHVATALETGCTFFMSEDRGTKRLPHELRFVGADASGVAQVLAALQP